ncbi:MAG: ATP-NAD kinase family protein, partial [Parvibaculaceae bacterium]
MRRRFSLGLIVNPVAGLGGRVGLKGTDGLAEEALKRGAVPLAGAKTLRALARLAAKRQPLVALLTGHGPMGHEAAARLGFLAELVSVCPRTATDAADTRAAALEMMRKPVDLILFAGGDGTARDIFDVVGDRTPLLGIPAGVKMQSAVFATAPEAAGEIVSALAAETNPGRIQYRLSEVMDLDEDMRRQGAISPRLHGYARVPHVPRLLQNAKARSMSLNEAAVDEAARELARKLDPQKLYAIGPGRTTKKILEALGLEGALLGTDLIAGGRLIARDADEQAILAAAGGRALGIVVGVIGGQGYVFGRGNQEISPAVIRMAGKAAVTVIAAQEKLLALPDRRLLVDTGDAGLDRELQGFWRI